MKKKTIAILIFFVVMLSVGLTSVYATTKTKNIKNNYSYVDSVVDEINVGNIEYIKTDLDLYEIGKLYKENYMEADENGKLVYKTKYKMYVRG